MAKVLIVCGVWILVVGACLGAELIHQRSVGPGDVGSVSSSTQPVSPVAMLTWVSRVGTLGKELELLVIWRGSPGWFFKGAQGGTSTNGNSASFQTSIRYGQVVLELTFKRTDRIATVQGKEVRLDGKNVILVDAADAPDGPRVVETLLIDSAFPPDRIEPVLRRSPKTIDFIQCDLKLPSERLNAVVQKLCAEIMK